MTTAEHPANDSNHVYDDQIGDDQIGDNHIGDNQIGHNHIGHNHIGHNHIGHNHIGDNDACDNLASDNQMCANEEHEHGEDEHGEHQLEDRATEDIPWKPAFGLSAGYSDVQILRALTNEVDAGRAAALITVTATARSVPRHAGAKLLVISDGKSTRTLGTVGGGEMEARCIIEATAALADGTSRTLTYELLDAANGDPGVCGGTVELFVEPFLPTPTVYVIGCGHVGAAVVNLAKWMGYRVVATDDRAALATQANLPGADAVFAGPFAAALEAEPIGAHTSVVVVTRNMAVDLELLPLVLDTSARFVGVMGSARRWATTAAALADRGVSGEALARVHSPIGLNINAETPEEIAVSIMAAVVADRRAQPLAPQSL